LFVLVTFGITFNLSFGADLYEMRSFLESLFGVIRMLFGEFDFDGLSNSNRVFGPVFFLMFMLFTAIVLMNMFIAVISDIYIAIQQHNSEVWDIYITSLMIKEFRHRERLSLWYRFINIGFIKALRTAIKLMIRKCSPSSSKRERSYSDVPLAEIEISSQKKNEDDPPQGLEEMNRESLSQSDFKFDLFGDEVQQELKISLNTSEIDQKVLEVRSKRINPSNTGLLQAIRSEVHKEMQNIYRNISQDTNSLKGSVQNIQIDLQTKVQAMNLEIVDVGHEMRTEMEKMQNKILLKLEGMEKEKS